MKRKFTFLIAAAFLLLTMMARPVKVMGQERAITMGSGYTVINEVLTSVSNNDLVVWGTSNASLGYSISNDWLYCNGTSSDWIVFKVETGTNGFYLKNNADNKYVYSSAAKKISFNSSSKTLFTIVDKGTDHTNILYGANVSGNTTTNIGYYTFNSTGIRPYASSAYTDAHLYKVIPPHTLNYSATNGNITGVNSSTSATVSTGASLAYGTIVNLTANPAQGYEFESWSDGGTNTLSNINGRYATFTMGESDVTITATFVLASSDPLISVSTASLSGFSCTQHSGNPSESQSFTVSGVNLEGNINFALDENSSFEISSDNTTFGSSINSLSPTNGTVTETTIYARLKASTTWGDKTGSINITSTNATPKSISLSGSVTPTYSLTYSTSNGSIAGVLSGTSTAVESGTYLLENTEVELTAQPSEGYRFVSWSDGGNNATLSSTTDNPTTFTMGTANITVTATFEVIPTHTVTFSVNGTTTTNDFGEGTAIIFPNNPANINGMSFMGWVSATISGTTHEAPAFVTSATMGTSDSTFYAVYAMATSDTAVEFKAQTLQYDTWTYGGSTTNKNGYRLFHNGGYVESAAFDLSKLSKVIVYGGTFGGNSYNSLTIGEGSNVWKNVTVTGSSETGTNAYTNGTALTGTKKLRVASTCGSSNSSGVRMSKIEIYITAIPYAYYCTTVPAALPPVITVAENPFVISTTATITCPTPEATIKYSFDNTNWEDYSSALTITTTTTIYAKALKGNGESTVSSVEITKNLAEPTVTIDASGITNTNVFNGTSAGSLSATVTYNDNLIEGATVTWSGDHDEVATINASTGAVTLVGAGSVTFTATFEANSDYSEKTATYDMTVTNVNPNGAGTRCNPYTVAQARTVIGGLTGNSGEVYVSGIIYYVDSYSSSSITYWISDNGSGTYSNNDGIQVFKGKGINGANFTAKSDLAVGDQVIVKGTMSFYNNTKYQINSGSKQVLYAYAYDSDDDDVIDSYDCYKAIEGYGSNAGGYYFVSTPVEMAPNYTETSGNNEYSVGMITDDGSDPENYSYDLYLFDESQNQEWRNYRQGVYNIVPGKGYLYANKENVTINFWGEPTATSTTLSKTSNAEFEGMNLVGNPLGTNAYINNRPFYIMNSEGTELLASTRNYIFPMEGIFVNASNDGELLNFSTTAPVENPGKGNLNIQVNQELTGRGASRATDCAVVSFDENGTLPKFMMNPDNTKVYIPQNGKDYAVVNAEAKGDMPVNFKAAENGTYTIDFSMENVEFNYLHLIDNKTGANVDLLTNPSYSFEAKTTDYASRFRLLFNANNVNDNENEDFAFVSDGNIVITNQGEATLQVIDMLGRIVSTQTVNGNATINAMNANGVYVLRLINGNNVKVQKIVVK